MLAIFFGTDTIAARRAALDFLAAEQGPDQWETIDADRHEGAALADLAANRSLFSDRVAYLIDMPSGRAELFSDMIETAALLAGSDNLFVVIEGPLLADAKKKLGRHADPFVEHAGAKAARFNSFTLADALAKKDKRLLWLLWNEALLAGSSPEELAGILWWQLKTMRLAKLGANAAAVGLKDFPYKKAKGALPRFAAGELERLSRSLLTLLHESRLGRQDLGLSLERWILRL